MATFRKFTPVLLLALLLPVSCKTSSSDKKDESDSSWYVQDADALTCSAPNRAELNKPFTMMISLPLAPPLDKNSDQSPKAGTEATVDVTMLQDETVSFDRTSFQLKRGQKQPVRVTIKATTAGLASVRAVAAGDFTDCEALIDVGFMGHLQIPSGDPLEYGTPRTLDIQLLDSNNKPLNLGISNLQMEIQTTDGHLITYRKGEPPREQQVVTLNISTGASRSELFSLEAGDWRGGPVNLTASLKIENGAVLTQSNLSLESKPATWLPILLAIGGAALFAAYRLAQSSDIISPATLGKTAATVAIAGLIAWMFADFDLLGLKLDPKVLRTYLILGFLSSFLGIDVLLKNRFANTKPITDKEKGENKANRDTPA